MSYNSNINLYEFDNKGGCFADITLPESGVRITELRVVPGLGGGVIVHMPKGMGTHWGYTEIAWSEVRKMIVEAYRKDGRSVVSKTENVTALKKKTAVRNIKESSIKNTDVLLYDYDEEGNCYADIVVPKTKTRVSGFRVMQGNGNGVIVHMPKWMKSHWGYSEVEWKDVRKIIAEKYIKEKSAEMKEPVIKFYSEQIRYIYDVNVYLNLANLDISNISLIEVNERIYVTIQTEEKNILEENGISIESLEERIRTVYEEGECIDDSIVTVGIGDCRAVEYAYLADVTLPHSSYTWIGFRVRQAGDGSVGVLAPTSLKSFWNDKTYPWAVLVAIIRKEFIKWKTEQIEVKKNEVSRNKETEEYAEINPESISGQNAENIMEEGNECVRKKEVSPSKEKNTLGRMKNADISPFRFVPHTVLQLENISDEKKRNMYTLISAINKRNTGGIGPFEIEILDWINRMKYMNNTMLLDLIRSGYISLGWREKISSNKLMNIVNRLYTYDLVDLTRFVAVDDAGNVLSDSKSAMRVLSIGKTGYTLLKELGRRPVKRSTFSVLQDGNTVKKCLSANQWIVYWLSHYPKEAILNYETSHVVSQMGAEWNGARLYASVNLGTASMVVEPIRRCEDFETEKQVAGNCEKLNRFIEMFDNLDQLYSDREQVVYPSRPILVYICEDDEHMNELKENLSGIIEDSSQQDVWFSTDLRIYNYDMKGQRFFKMEGSRLVPIDLYKELGVEEKGMHETKFTKENVDGRKTNEEEISSHIVSSQPVCRYDGSTSFSGN